MITKKVNRYYCEFCKKSGGSAGHLKKHEERCTMNPNRHCGVCDLKGKIQQPAMRDLLALVPRWEEITQEDSYGFISVKDKEILGECLKKLREASDSCPACIMAAFRQRGIPVPEVSDFSFTEEMNAVWHEFNNSQVDDHI